MDNNSNTETRQLLLSVLSKSPLESINQYWKNLDISPDYSFLKKSEIGMAMVKAKAGGAGQEFNMGEMTVTRSVIMLNTKEIGYGYTAGRDKKKSVLIALIDACFQTIQWQSIIATKLLNPLMHELQTQHTRQQEKVDRTKVNFFTMVRGED